jgi:hypothetical protein
MVIRLNEAIIDDLSLRGTAAALQTLNRCYARLQARLEAERREKARWAELPRDPFAPKLNIPTSPDLALLPKPDPADAPMPQPPSGSALDDIAAPLRAQVARQRPIGSGDEQMRSLFDNWQRLEGDGK